MQHSDPIPTTVANPPLPDPAAKLSVFREVEIDGEVDRSGELGTVDAECSGECVAELVDELMVASV